jgi:hypothetical protein
MVILCKKLFPSELAALQNSLTSPAFRPDRELGLRRAATYSEEDDQQQDESEEEEEDEDTTTSNRYGLDVDDKWDDGVTLVESGPVTVYGGKRWGLGLGLRRDAIPCFVRRCNRGRATVVDTFRTRSTPNLRCNSQS